MDENARKRKREEEVLSEVEGVVLEKPMQVAKKAEKQAKKQKRDAKTGAGDVEGSKGVENNKTKDPEPDINTLKRAKADKEREKKERRKAKEKSKAAKLEVKKERKKQQAAAEEESKVDLGVGDHDPEDDNDPRNGELGQIDIGDILNEPNEEPTSTATPSPTAQSPAFDASTAQSGSSSITSLAPTTTTIDDLHMDKPAPKSETPKPDPEELKARLQQRIDELRAARKADGLNGNPARNRQELMDARRRKEEQRRAHKKELRLKAKEEEQRVQSLTLARGSPLLSPASGSNALPSPLRDSEPSNNFSFGRVAFPNGQVASAQLSHIIDAKKLKGPQDPLTALQAAELKKSRLSGLDEAKRMDIEEKDVWLHAHKRVSGERIRDDTSLLKKTLKRKEREKKKSGKEWGERIEGVARGQAMRQKKREENISKRREEKGGKKGSGKKGGATKKAKGKPKARPGFEGSFRAKAPSSGEGGGAGKKK